MASFEFKLKKTNDLTRLANFVEQPTWEALSSKIISLYKIQSNQVCVPYVDGDDLVTIDFGLILTRSSNGFIKSTLLRL